MPWEARVTPSAPGYPAAGMCLPLGNYHNMGPGGKIRPERIDLGDFESLVKLLVATARDGRPAACRRRTLRGRLANLLTQRGRLLRQGEVN